MWLILHKKTYNNIVKSYQEFMKNTFELYHINGKKHFFKNIFNGTKFKE